MSSTNDAIDADTDGQGGSTDVSSLLNNCCHDLRSVRISSLNELLSKCYNSHECPPMLAKRICRVIINSSLTKKNDDKEWNALLNDSLIQFCENRMNASMFQFVPFLLQCLTDYVSVRKGTCSPDSQSHMVCLCSHILATVSITEANDVEVEWIKSLIAMMSETLVSLTDAVESTYKIKKKHMMQRLTDKALISIIQALELNKSIRSIFFSTLTEAPANKKNDVVYIAVLALLVPYVVRSKGLIPYYTTEIIHIVLQCYKTRIIESRSASIAMSNNFRSFLSTLTIEEWPPLMEATLNTMKKAPEGSSGVVSALFEIIQVDLSSIVIEGGVPYAIKATKGIYGELLCKSLLRKCRGNSQAFSMMITSLVEALQGKAGSLLPNQKVAILNVLIDSTRDSDDAKQVFSTVAVDDNIVALCSQLEKEMDENIRIVIGAAIGGMLRYMSTIKADLLATFKKLFNSKGRNTCTCLLISCCDAMKHNHAVLVPLLVELVPTLQSILKDFAKAPSQPNSDAMMSLLLLLDLSTTAEAAASIAIDATKLISSSLDILHNRALLDMVTASSSKHVAAATDSAATTNVTDYDLLRVSRQIVSSSIICSFFAILATIIRHYPTHFPSKSRAATTEVDQEVDDVFYTSTRNIYGVILSYMNTITNANALKQMTDAHTVVTYGNVTSKLLAALLVGLDCAATRKEERATKAACSSISVTAVDDDLGSYVTQDKGGGISVPIPSHVSSILDYLLGSSSVCSILTTTSSNITSKVKDDDTINTLLLCSHPLLSVERSRAMRLWSKVTADIDINAIITPTRYDSICTTISEACQSTVETIRSTGHVAIHILYCVCGDVVRQHLVVDTYLPLLMGNIRLQADDIFTITPNEIDIYMNPSKAINSIVAATQQQSSVDSIRITNADRKRDGARSSRRGNFGSDIVEDVDWEAKIRAEKLKKLNESKAEGNSVEIKKQQLLIEEMNSRVRSRIQCMEFHISTVSSFSSMLLNDCCYLILPAIIPLLSSPLLIDRVVACLNRFIQSLDQELAIAFGRDIVDAIRIATTSDSSTDSDSERLRSLVYLSAPIIRLVKGMQHLAIKGFNFSICSMHLLFPVLRSVLLMPSLLPGCEAAWMVFEHMWSKQFVRVIQDHGTHHKNVTSLRSLNSQCLQVCVWLLNKIRVDPPADAVLLSFATALELSSNEWLPLLGALGLQAGDSKTRATVLRAIQAMLSRGHCITHVPTVEVSIWICTFDEDEAACEVATSIWNALNNVISEDYYAQLQNFLYSSTPVVRSAAGRAIAGTMLKHLSGAASSVITSLKSMFHNALPEVPEAPQVLVKSSNKTQVVIMNKPPAAVVDNNSAVRDAISITIAAMGEMKSVRNNEHLTDLLDFVLSVGVTDYNAEVRASMLKAGKALIDGYDDGDKAMVLLGKLEVIIAKKVSKEEDVKAFDLRHEAATVLLGAVGKHLNKDDAKLLDITNLMVESLNIPSESVQKSVSDSLVSLIQVIKANPGDYVKDLLEDLMNRVLNAETYGGRRGAAYGISALVKGLGIPSLKQYDVVNRLKDACTNGSVNNRQGALFAFECLSERMGLLFEPYVISIIPILLRAFSHSSDHVREASQIAAKVIMAKLSAHGVKQVLTPILASLPTESQWKTRQESIRLLGTMAYCAPRQLASCLPQVVPRLIEAFSDPHPKVKECVKTSLADISSVIRNPEVARLSPVLLAALSDPAHKTKEALEALLECEFMHSIDAASLAILVPLLGRALRDRGADLKRKSSAITGNMMTMVSETKTLAPYLSQLLPGLKDCLIDPIPDVRATSAKALGSLMGVGEEELPDLVPWLIEMLQTDTSPVERSGAAQGLSEVSLTLGNDRFESILLQVLALSEDPKSSAREGLLWYLSFLPPILNDAFAKHIKVALPIVLMGLCDNSEGVREVSMRAGQIFVSVLGRAHTAKLLPSLSDGMFHSDWRIRHSSVLLLGELLYLIGDTKAAGVTDNDNDDDDAYNFQSSSRVAVSIRAHIGDAETDHVFASLYIVKSDTSRSVGQAANQVWKTIISNSPRTLTEILPSLVKSLIHKLSSDDSDLRIVGGRALGEVVKKLGDKLLPLIVPQLQQGLHNDNEGIREGVVVGLTEILGSASKNQIEIYIKILVAALQQGLCDRSERVRCQAGKAFLTLYKSINNKAIDEVIPQLLEKLSGGVDAGDDVDDDGDDVDTDGDSSALLGLKEVVFQRPRDLLEYLLPKLLAHPMQVTSSKTLGVVATVASTHLNYHFQLLVTSIVNELIVCSDTVEALTVASQQQAGDGEDMQQELSVEVARLNAVKDAAACVFGSVTTSGLHYLTSELGKQIEHEDIKHRQWGCVLTEMCFAKSKADFLDYIPVFLKFCLGRIAETSTVLLQAVGDAIAAIFSSVAPEDMMIHLDFVLNCTTSAASDARHREGGELLIDTETGNFMLPLFSLPRTIEPFLTVFIYGLMNGSHQIREVAADGIGQFASMSNAAVLKPYLIKTTGPLIRVVGDRFPSDVKASILKTLGVLLDKGSMGLKAFAPQLQTTFIKALNDPSKQVRSRASDALSKLMSLITRVDPLVLELSTACTTAESTAIKASIYDALTKVILRSGDKMTSSIDKCKAITTASLLDDDDNVRNAACSTIAALSCFLDTSTITDILLDLTDASRCIDVTESPTRMSGRLVGVGSVLQSAGKRADELREDAFAFIKSGITVSNKPSVKCAALTACSLLVTPITYVGSTDRKAEYRAVAQVAVHYFAKDIAASVLDTSDPDSVRVALTTIKQTSKYYRIVTQKYAHIFLPVLAEAVKDVNLRIVNIGQRAMRYLLDIANDPNGAVTHTSSLDADVKNFVRDYSKRILIRLNAGDSDDEGGKA